MNEKDTVLVFGATGNIGPHTVSRLLDKGVDTRVLVLENDPNLGRIPEGAEVFYGDLADPDSLDASLEGVTSVFLMWPFFTLGVETAPDVVKKIKNHTERIVFVSSIGVHIGLEPVDNNCHAYLEELIEKEGMEWTFLQTTGFCCNAVTAWADQIRSGDTLSFPYGAAARSPIHEEDLAEVAARALTEKGHAGQRYVVTGPEALSQIEQMQIISEALGRELTWVDVPHETVREAMVAGGWPEAYADGALEYFAMLVDEPEKVTGTVERVLGKPPRDFREWAFDNAHKFR
ncbi:NmrA family NAD(P)-binding protein [Actinopolyspora mortivallis]|uniref:Nucleoside-diphosphate sugar epimerase n=1 Tax=Actinopolyspora mortivallis TaxID=33906 RepID=A0A2T0GYN0_ACTMO|nr:NAD(P)H-binding protein [Actinopolyspora mortivallis]PRW64216.1 nucleoside-diphosphate sugar epimerase [Actinopolyspora mortivallis]